MVYFILLHLFIFSAFSTVVQALVGGVEEDWKRNAYLVRVSGRIVGILVVWK